MKKLFFVSIAVVGLFTSCEKKEDEKVFTSTDGPKLIVSNEGPFSSGSGSLSVIELSSGKVTNDVYADNNGGATVGSILQDIEIKGNVGYASINNADEVLVFNGDNYQYRNVVPVTYPRYIVSDDNYVYVCGGNLSGKVTKINNSTGSKVGDVAVGTNPDGIAHNNNWVVTSNKGSWTDGDSTISVINKSTFKVDTTINVGFKPRNVVFDSNGDLWVLVSDGGNNTTKTELVRLTTEDWIIQERVKIAENDESVTKLNLNEDGTKLYYWKSDGLYVYEIGQVVNSTPIIAKGNHQAFYALEINSSNGNIFTFDAMDYSSKGIVRAYTAAGDSITQYEVGVIPNGGVFR